MTLISVPRSSRWVAKLWRSACSVTPFLIPAASADSWNSRLSWRVVIGLPRLWPGNSQRSSTGVPASSQPIEHLGREDDVAILAAFRLLNANDLLCAIDMFDLQPDDPRCADQ